MSTCASPVVHASMTVGGRSDCALLMEFHASCGDGQEPLDSQFCVRSSSTRVMGWLFLMVSSGCDS